MSFLEYLPIALAVSGIALRFVISNPAVQVFQAWEEASSLQHEPSPATTHPAVLAKARVFAAA